MKRSIIVLSIAFVACLTACYEDKSTSGTVRGEISVDINTDEISNGILTIANGETLSLEPIINQKDALHSDFSYLWELTLTSDEREKKFSILGEEKNLNWVITRAPSTYPYTLVYTVTDNNTGISCISSLKIRVVNSAGDGVVVADTRDGRTSDLTLVRSKHLSHQYSKDTFYKRNAYSATNGTAFDGIIEEIFYGRVGIYGKFKYYLYAMSEKNIESLTTDTYSVNQDLSQLFMLVPTGGTFTRIFPTKLDILAVYDDDLYGFNSTQISNFYKFGDPYNYVKPSEIASKRHVNRFLVQNPGTFTSFIDDTDGKLYCYDLFNQKTIRPMTQGISANAYPPDQFSGYTQIGSFLGVFDSENSSFEFFHILESPQNEIKFYGNTYRYDKEEGAAVYETTRACTTVSCPDIAQAFAFDGCVTREVVFYATQTKVYSCVLGASSAASTPQFTAPKDQIITAIKVYRDSWFNTSSKPNSDNKEETSAMHDNLLMVATYDSASGEGTLYALPISGASGTLTQSDAEHTYTGFGKITALAVQGNQ